VPETLTRTQLSSSIGERLFLLGGPYSSPSPWCFPHRGLCLAEFLRFHLTVTTRRRTETPCFATFRQEAVAMPAVR
jgi:hypothetical protein